MTDTQKSSKQYELMSPPPFLLAILFFRGGGEESMQFNRYGIFYSIQQILQVR